jgi:hypothetical protein
VHGCPSHRVSGHKPLRPCCGAGVPQSVRIPAIASTRSGLSRPVVPEEGDHRFRSKPTTRRIRAKRRWGCSGVGGLRVGVGSQPFPHGSSFQSDPPARIEANQSTAQTLRGAPPRAGIVAGNWERCGREDLSSTDRQDRPCIRSARQPAGRCDPGCACKPGHGHRASPSQPRSEGCAGAADSGATPQDARALQHRLDRSLEPGHSSRLATPSIDLRPTSPLCADRLALTISMWRRLARRERFRKGTSKLSCARVRIRASVFTQSKRSALSVG